MAARKSIAPNQPARPKWSRLFQRLRHPYRLVFIDDATLSEVASFRLTKGNVWSAVSAIALLSILLTTAVLVFSPLKYYIPGYGNSKMRSRVLRLQQETDSLADLVTAQTEQAQRIQAVITGENPIPRDTTPLAAREIERAEREGPLPTAAAVEAAAVPARNSKPSRRR